MLHRLTTFVAAALLAMPLGAQSDLARGREAFEARRYHQARPAFQAAARADARDATAPLYLGRIALLEGDAQGAVKWLEQATARAPKNGEAHRWLGRAYARQARRAGKFRQAMLAGKVRTAFETAVALDPDDVEARRDLMQFYLVAPGIVGGGRDKAQAQARELAKRSPLYARVSAGWLAEQANDAATARREYEAAIAAFPDSAIGYASLGGLHQRAKRWDDAVATYERLLARRPDAADALYSIGRVAALSGTHLERGATALTRYLERQPGEEEPALASAHLRLATVRERQGDKPAARRHFEAALRLDAGLEEAREGLKRVK